MGTQAFDEWLSTGRSTRLSPAAVQQLRDAAEEIDECEKTIALARTLDDRGFYIISWGLVALALEAVPIAARWMGFEDELPPGRIAIPAVAIAVLLFWVDRREQKRRIFQAQQQTTELNNRFFRRWGVSYVGSEGVQEAGPPT